MSSRKEPSKAERALLDRIDQVLGQDDPVSRTELSQAALERLRRRLALVLMDLDLPEQVGVRAETVDGRLTIIAGEPRAAERLLRVLERYAARRNGVVT